MSSFSTKDAKNYKNIPHGIEIGVDLLEFVEQATLKQAA